MSSIDNRIVEMQFNNKRFEENARQSMSTLDKLKEKLNFKSSTKEIEDFQKAADSFNLSHIASAVDEIGDKFTLMGQLGYQAMQRIASAALNAGTALVKSISIDQITAGMSKYEQETNVIQTLYGALKPKGTKLQEIYDTMADLTAYSDETSYSYTQMADAVSKFVNAGVDLKEAETVIEGISNAAALAGIGIHDTEIIYRNFSDAIGKGGFRATDWKSIKIAHMDTQWLQEAFIQEAINQKKLDETGRVLIKAEKRNKKGKITQEAVYKNVKEDFEGTLVKGWLDTEVINAVMLKYATRDLEGFGKEAFAAAQNAKTFTDVIDAVKDSVSTGWSQSFRIIFGDLEEAIAFFTPMANKVIAFTASIDAARNTLLGQWKDLGGRDSMIGALDNIWTSLNNISDAVSSGLIKALYDSFYPMWQDLENSETNGGIWELMGEQLSKLTKGIEETTQAFNDWLNGSYTETGEKRITAITHVFKGLFSVVNIIRMALKGVSTFFGKIFKQLQPTVDAILGLFRDIGYDLGILNRDLSSQKGFTTLAENLAAMFDPLTKRLPKVINWIRNLYKRFKVFWNSNPRFVKLRTSIERMFNSFIKFVPEAIESAIKFGKSFVEMVKNSDEWKILTENYNKYIKPAINRIQDGATKVADAFSDFFEMDTSDEKTLWGKIKKRFSAFEKLGPWLTETWEKLKKNVPWFQDIEDWWTTDPIVQEIKAWVSQIAHAVDVFLSADTSGETSIVGKIKKRFEAMWAELGPWLTQKWAGLKSDYPILQTIEDVLTSLFGGGSEAKKAAKKADESGEETVGFLQKLWTKVQDFASKLNVGNVLTFAVAIAALVKLYKLVKGVANWVSLGETITEAIEGITIAINDAHKTAKAQNLKTKAETLAAVAASVWLFADAIKRVSDLNWEQIGKGIVSMVVMMGAELGFMKLLEMINGSPATKFGEILGEISQGLKNVGQLTSLALNILAFGAYLKMVADISWESMDNGLRAMVDFLLSEAIFLAILEFLEGEDTFGSIMSNLASGIVNTSSLMDLSINLLAFGTYLNMIASLSWDSIQNGISAMSVLLLEEALFLGILKALEGVGEKGKPFTTLATGISNASLLGTLSLNLLAFGGYLNTVAGLSWDSIQNGISAMSVLLLEEAMFLGIIKALEGVGEKGKPFTTLANGISNSILLTSLSVNLLTFSGYLNTLANLSWGQIEQGLLAMGALYFGDGAIAWFLKNFVGGGFDTAALTAAIGVLAGGTSKLAESVATFAKLSFGELVMGFVSLIGVILVLKMFIQSVYDLPPIEIKEMLGVALAAGAIFILAKGLEALCQFDFGHIVNGLVGMAGMSIIFFYLLKNLQSIESIGIKTLLSTIVSAITMAALMVAFAFAVSMIKDVDPLTILAFSGAMILVSAAMETLSKTLAIFSGISLGSAVKGTAIMVIAATGLAAAVALILTIVGQSIQDFSNNIAVVGANLAQYSEQVAGINLDAVGNSVTMIKDLAAVFVEVGAKDYGNLETFRTNITRMGSSLKLFGLNTATLDTEKMKTITSALKDMANDLGDLKAVSDVSTTIGNIGGAIKLYSESLNGVELTNVPDATSIQTVLDSLKGAMPSDEDMTEVAGYAAEGKGDQMTDFAIGLTNIATAVSTFSENAKDLDFDNIGKATEALTAISSLNTDLGTTTVANFGPFAVEVSNQKESLSTFAEDIVALGSALNDFGTNIGAVNPDNLTLGAGVLEKFAEVNKALPPTGGISQWLTGTQSLTNFAANLRLLGGGTKAFGESISGGTIDLNEVNAAGDALIKIAEVNAKLPETGGISSWFTGDESLSGFGTGLKELGKGVADFATSFGDTKITDEISKAVAFINRLAGIQIKLSSVENWYSLSTFGGEFNQLVTSAIEANNKLSEMYLSWEDPTDLINLVGGLADVQVKLGNITFRKSLADLGSDMNRMLTEIHNFTVDVGWFSSSDNTKLQLLASVIQNILDLIGTLGTEGDDTVLVFEGENIIGAIVTGMGDDASIKKVTDSVNDLGKKICDTIIAYKSSFRNAGTWIPYGLGQGIWANRYAAINQAIYVMNATIKAAEREAQINSPSKRFAEIGMYSDMGLAQGLRDSVYLVDTAASQVSRSALDTILNDMQIIQDLPLDQLEINPTIRPVLDMSDISTRAGMIDGLLGGSRSIGFNTRQLEAQAQILGDVSGTDIVAISEQITGLRDQLAQLEETMSNIKMVVDTGALVGAMKTDIDKTMGAMARRGERGN